jgi:hypothetical protein
VAMAAGTTAADALAKAMVVTATAGLAKSQAAAMRMNNVLSSINTTARSTVSTFTVDLVDGLTTGKTLMASLETAAASLGKTLLNAGLNSLVTTGLNAVAPGASQTASATASATILTSAGTTLAASMVAGATSASAILAGGGTAAGVGVDVGTSVGGAELVTSGATAGGFIATAAAALGVSAATLAAVMGPLAAVAAVAAGMGISIRANKQPTSETRHDNERVNYSKAA